jgi:cobalt-zinc-cadmium resistance protein CzcA
MLNWLIKQSLGNRLFVAICGLALIVVGLFEMSRLPVDAFPDTTPVQAQINVGAPALNPEEVEQQITQPLELAVSGLPGLSNVRSISKFGLAQVVVTFEDNVSIYRARQLISERLQGVALPEGIQRPELGPISTGLGEVFHYVVRSSNTHRTLAELREIQDWVIKPELRKTPGVAEINSWGGLEKQYHVVVEPRDLVKYHLTLDRVAEALRDNNLNVGGGQVVRAGESLLVHGVGLATNLNALGAIVITSHDGAPVRVSDVAAVRLDHEIRRGAVTSGGSGEAVLGLGFMLMGENSAEVTHALKERLAEVRKILPPDVTAEVLYDRTELVGQVINTVKHNLLAGAILVIAILFAFLGNFRAGLVVASAIPLAMLFAGGWMSRTGITASLLSLGAVDFGLIVDGAVVMVENVLRRLSQRQGVLGRPLTTAERQETLESAAIEVARPVGFGVGIILIVFLPVLALQGIEGKMFKPMALTMIYALSGSLMLALTLVPVLASLLLPKRVSEREPWVAAVARRLYEPFLTGVLRWRRLALTVAVLLTVGTVLLASRMGGEFLPRLGEQAIVGATARLAGISVEEAVASNVRLERALLEAFPDEIARTWTRLGSPEVATDPMGVELSDFFIALTPRSHWKKARTQEELAEKMRGVFNRFPGMTVSFSQPIEMRLNELVAGIRSDVGIKIYGDDLQTLGELSDQVQRVLGSIPGAGEISGEQLVGQPLLQVKTDPLAAGRVGVSVREVLDVVEALGSRKVGEVREGQRRFPLVLRLPDAQRTDPQALAATLIPTAAGVVMPLSQVASIVETEGPSTINREWGRRRITVKCNVSGGDVAGFVAQAARRINAEVKLPQGYSIEWGGQFENMQRANARLRLVVPLALGLIFALLYFSLKSVRDVLVVATGIPLGAVGGVLALWLRGMPFTVSAAVGFIALSGVAILNGLVLVSVIQQKKQAGASLEDAVREGCLERLRPVIMTALVAAVGFIPMALNTGVGGEVQRPLATVVVGGIATNTLLTLAVLPALYRVLGRRKVKAG